MVVVNFRKKHHCAEVHLKTLHIGDMSQLFFSCEGEPIDEKAPPMSCRKCSLFCLQTAPSAVFTFNRR